MDRRHFAKLSALSLAAAHLPVSAQQTSGSSAAAGGRRLGFAAVGLGSISDTFMKALPNTPNARLTGLVTGHPDEKGAKYSAQYGLPQTSIYTYETFDHIRDNREIEAVYIGLPNSMHCEYTVRAAEAGKHVFCEKPMAISSAECRRMIDACKRANVKLAIAYRVHYDPTFIKVRDAVRSGALGEVQSCLGGFYGNMPEGWRLHRPFAGGGSILDLGIYPLNAIRWMLGEEPSEFRAMVSTRDKGPRYATMEETVEWVMRFPSGILGSVGSSYGQNGGDFLQINGSKGRIRIEPAWGYDGPEITFNGSHAGNTGPNAIPVVHVDQFAAETSQFVDAVFQNKTPVTPGEEGLADLVAIEGIYAAAGTPIA